jgi:3-(3-hydroxy-phenyl)propionate hydroxylase
VEQPAGARDGFVNASASGRRVIVAGGGPVGLLTALGLARAGVPVLLLEQEPGLTVDLRAGSYHPPTLEAMAPYGITDRMHERGIPVRFWSIRDKANPDWVALWDLDLIADLTPYPYRLHLEQHQLTPIILDILRAEPLAEIRFGARFTGVTQSGDGVHVTYERDGETRIVDGAYVVGADGGRSAVRKAIGMAFEGYTWPERFFVISTSFDFETRGYTKNAYIADPDQWITLFKMPGDGPPGYWRIVIPTDTETPEDVVAAPENVQAWLQHFVPNATPYEILYNSFYSVHQRVAASFRHGRVLLAGDAAHLNNPLGAFGLNSGIQDAANLIPKLAAVWKGEASENYLDVYDRQRRTATIEFVQANSIRNKRLLEERDPAVRRERFEELVRTANTPELARQYLINSSMIAATRRAAEVA